MMKPSILYKNVYESLYANATNNTITAICCTSGLPLLLSLLCNELQKPASKTRKTLNWVILFFLSLAASSSGATRGSRKILNPPRSLRIWRELVRKQRRGVDYDDHENNVQGACSCSTEWPGGFSNVLHTQARVITAALFYQFSPNCAQIDKLVLFHPYSS